MFGLFDEKEKMSVPKSLDECSVADSTARELWRIAEIVESWGAIILIGLVILGLICSIVTNSFINGITREDSFSGFFVSLTIWAVVAVIEYVTYHLISLLIRAIASIVQSTRVSAKVALYNASKDSTPILSTSELQKNAQLVQKHSTISNRANIEDHSRNTGAPAIDPQHSNSGDIVCPKCGKLQNASRTVCWNCGQKFLKD